MFFFEKHGMEEKEIFRNFSLENHHFPLHFHHAVELIYVKDGQLYVSVDQKEFVLKKNDLAVIFPKQMHEFKPIDYSDTTVILFSPELIGDFFMSYKSLVPSDNVLHLEEALALDKLHSIYRQKSFLYTVCAELIAQTTFVPVKYSLQSKVLYKMLLYIEQNYASDCTLKDVSKYLKYDYPYISKLFAGQMNMTFTAYLNHYRISQACYLLKNSQQSISEIAFCCGYNNLRSFHRNFREIAGKSPKEYRTLGRV